MVRRTGDVRSRRVGGGKRSKRIEAFAPVILAAVEKKADITLAELRDLLAQQGVAVAISTLWHFFARRKITRKKSGRAAELDRPYVLRRRRVLRPVQGPDRTGPPAPGLHRRDGRLHQDGAHARAGSSRPAPEGLDPLRTLAPKGGEAKTTTFNGALRLTGMTAPMVLDGPMNGAWFHSYVEQVLVPTLTPCDVVILDNPPAHKGAAASEAIKAAGAQLPFLPPHSPDVNSIENAFSKPKAYLRKAAARTVDDLWAVIGQSLDVFTPPECANYFAAAGYDARGSESALSPDTSETRPQF